MRGKERANSWEYKNEGSQHPFICLCDLLDSWEGTLSPPLEARLL